jgi:hypothetical protein
MLMRTDAGDRDFMGLAEVDPQEPDVVKRWLIAEGPDIEGFTLDHTGRRAVVVTNQGVYDELRVIDLVTGDTTDRFPWTGGVVVSDVSGSGSYHLNWSHDNISVFASWEHPTHPAEIYEWPAHRRWTQSSDDADFHDLAIPSETTDKYVCPSPLILHNASVDN